MDALHDRCQLIVTLRSTLSRMNSACMVRPADGEAVSREIFPSVAGRIRPLMNLRATSSLDTSSTSGIIFDLDGTLIDSYEAIAGSLNHALIRLGRSPLPADRIRVMVGRGLEVLIARAIDCEQPGDNPTITEAVELFREHYDRTCVEKTTLLPDVGETLGALHERGYRMGVATNKPSYFARRLLDALGVGGLIPSVYGPDRVAHHKPHPEMVQRVLAELGLSASQAIYVGDMEVDIETARAAGVRVVVLPTGSCDLESLTAAGADLVVGRFSALLDLLPGRD